MHIHVHTSCWSSCKLVLFFIVLCSVLCNKSYTALHRAVIGPVLFFIGRLLVSCNNSFTAVHCTATCWVVMGPVDVNGWNHLSSVMSAWTHFGAGTKTDTKKKQTNTNKSTKSPLYWVHEPILRLCLHLDIVRRQRHRKRQRRNIEQIFNICYHGTYNLSIIYKDWTCKQMLCSLQL